MPRPWRGTRGSLLILTAKVNAPKSWIIIIRAKTYELYVSTFSTGNAAIVSWILWVTFIWSGVNMDLVLFFSDLPAWECFPAPTVSSGEFHHPHACTVHRISWSFMSHTGKMNTTSWPSHDSDKCAGVCLLLTMEFFFFLYLQGCQCSYAFICVLMWGNQYLQFLMDV